MAVSPEGVLLVARRRTSEVVALPDRDKDGVAEPAVILSGMTNAHSLAFKDGYLYVATTPAVMRVRWVNGAPAGTPEMFGELPSSTPSLHTSRTIAFGKDGRLYVSIGSSCNVCLEPDPRRTTIQVFSADGSSLTPYAIGLRNTIGFDWDPQTGRMWGADTGQDGGGPAFPPEEINLIEAGKHYGYPFFVGRNLPNEVPELKDVRPTVSHRMPYLRCSSCHRTRPGSTCASTLASSFPRHSRTHCFCRSMAPPPFRKRWATRSFAS